MFIDDDKMNPLDKALETMGANKEVPLSGSERHKINRDLQKLLKPTYFRKIPLASIAEVLEKHSVVMLQEDHTEWAGILCGKKGRLVCELADSYNYLPIGGTRLFYPYTNAMLILTWYKMPETGNYEVLCYVS